jgi:hypothetical protein
MKRFVFAFLIATCSALSLLHAQESIIDDPIFRIDDPITDYYIFSIINIDEYLQFLNDQATKSDPHGLYSESLDTSILREILTDESGVVQSYNYKLASGVDCSGLIEISYLSACRYCNWYQSKNTPDSKSQLDEVTEKGAYDITDTNGEEIPTFNKETAKFKLSVLGKGFVIGSYNCNDSEQRNPTSDKKDNQVKDIPVIDKTDQTTGSSTDSKPSYSAGLSTPVKAALVIAAVAAVVALGYLALGYFGSGAAADIGGTAISDFVSKEVIKSGSKEVLIEAAEGV